MVQQSSNRSLEISDLDKSSKYCTFTCVHSAGACQVRTAKHIYWNVFFR